MSERDSYAGEHGRTFVHTGYSELGDERTHRAEDVGDGGVYRRVWFLLGRSAWADAQNAQMGGVGAPTRIARQPSQQLVLEDFRDSLDLDLVQLEPPTGCVLCSLRDFEWKFNVQRSASLSRCSRRREPMSLRKSRKVENVHLASSSAVTAPNLPVSGPRAGPDS